MAAPKSPFAATWMKKKAEKAQPEPQQEVKEQELAEVEAAADEVEKEAAKAAVPEPEKPVKKRRTTGGKRVMLTDEQKAYILKHYTTKTFSQIAKDLHLRPVNISNFIKSLKNMFVQVIESPDVPDEVKEKAQMKLEFLMNARYVPDKVERRKKMTPEEKASLFDEIFAEIMK